jgi:hypothetical protein
MSGKFEMTIKLTITTILTVSIAFAMLVPIGAVASVHAVSGFNTPGNILISDQFNDRVIEITNPGTASGTIVASYGTINDPGYSPSTASFLNGPYSAYVIGDYTGLTNPF